MDGDNKETFESIMYISCGDENAPQEAFEVGAREWRAFRILPRRGLEMHLGKTTLEAAQAQVAPLLKAIGGSWVWLAILPAFLRNFFTYFASWE